MQTGHAKPHVIVLRHKLNNYEGLLMLLAVYQETREIKLNSIYYIMTRLEDKERYTVSLTITGKDT
jgi:hypothetical protein